MKVPPKRKGNNRAVGVAVNPVRLNESPSEKEGKSDPTGVTDSTAISLNESPSEKEGK